MKVSRPDWSGRTVVCIASGPSLTPEDVALVQASGHPTIVTNTTFRLAPWADVVFGMDANWWRQYVAEVKGSCTGRLMCTSHAVRSLGVEALYACPWFPNFGAGNSGMAIIRLALAGKAQKIVLLGYDCQKTEGKMHWHGDHPKGLGNGASLKRWPKHFEHVARDAKNASCLVLNASRVTALKCFERAELESAL